MNLLLDLRLCFHAETRILEFCPCAVDVFASEGCPRFEWFFLFGREANRLILECLRFLVMKNLLRAWRERLTRFVKLVVCLDRETELLRPVAPVQHVRLFGRIVPVD